MAKNLIPIIVKELGVEIGEEFKLKNKNGVTLALLCRFTEEELEWYSPDGDAWGSLNHFTGHLINGEIEIVKLPWQPKRNEAYWSLAIPRYGKPYPGETTWDNDEIDYALSKLELIYRTKEECEKNLKADYEKLTGEKWKWEDA